MNRLFGFALIVFGGVGCSGEEPTQPQAVVEPSSIVQQLAAAQCERMLGCCSEDELSSLFGASLDQAGCEAALSSQADAFLVPSLDRAQDAGTIVLIEGGVAACVSAIASTSCEDFEPNSLTEVIGVSECAPIVAPKLTLSGFCTDDFECDTGLCSHPPADTEGTCKAKPQIGEECLHDRCDDFLACSADGVCVEKLGVGDVCARNADCRSGRCEPNDTGEVVCVEAPRSCEG